MKGKAKTSKKPIDERPLDPTRNAGHIIGDTSGLTGVTTGSPKQSSSEPNDFIHDTEHLPGGIKDFPGPTKTGIPKESESEKVYKGKVIKGESSTYKKRTNGIASEKNKSNSTNYPYRAKPVNSINSPKSEADEKNQRINTTNASDQAPYNRGEQSVSGSAPSVNSDDDLLDNAHAVGTQLGEDLEHPEEVDVGRDIDEAEEYEQNH